MSAKRKVKTAKQNGEYEVGRGKPPKATQFKPRQSGNPKGKRKGTENKTTIVRRTLNGKIWITEDGKRKKLRVMRAYFESFRTAL